MDCVRMVGTTMQPHLVKEWQRAALAASVKVRHVDQLEVERKPRVCDLEGRLLADSRQVAQAAVAPIVELGKRRPRTALAWADSMRHE